MKKKELIIVFIFIISIGLISFGVYLYFDNDLSNKLNNIDDKKDKQEKSNKDADSNINDSDESASVPEKEGDVIKSYSKKEEVIRAYKNYNLKYESTDEDGCFIFKGENSSRYLYCTEEGILRQIETETFSNSE